MSRAASQIANKLMVLYNECSTVSLNDFPAYKERCMRFFNEFTLNKDRMDPSIPEEEKDDLYRGGMNLITQAMLQEKQFWREEAEEALRIRRSR